MLVTVIYISACLSNWRNGFATAAADAFNQFKNEHAKLLDSPEMIAECVEAHLVIKGDLPHCPFWWREWAEDEGGKIQRKVRLSL